MKLENFSIRAIYFYLISFVSLLIILFNVQAGLTTLSRYLVFKTAPDYTYQPPFFPLGSSMPMRPIGKGVLDAEKASTELLEALKNNKNITDEQKQMINQWLADYENWKKYQEDDRRRLLDSLIGNTIALILFTPAFLYHFRKARET